MKTSSDPRHLHREILLKKLFSFGFKDQGTADPDLKPVIAELDAIDRFITASAPEWPISQINRVDLAVLRLAIFELTVTKKEPPRVIIDEAVELAKKYGSEKSPGFVNGVLGAVFEKQAKDNKA